MTVILFLKNDCVYYILNEQFAYGDESVNVKVNYTKN